MNRPHRLGVFAFALLALSVARAQETQRITITGSAAPRAPGVAGFGDDLPLARTPLAATVIDQQALRDAGISSLGDITRLDAGITDAYNAPGYWNQLAVRGYTVDNRYNVRRDGLPVNAETVIGPANKQRLEVLKGTSGLQAGTSAPGGLVNVVVKRPRQQVRDGSLSFTQDGTLEAAADLGDRGASFGWRVNASGARLDPRLRSSRGERALAAGAVEWRLSDATLLEAEVEASRQRQPSTPGFSLLGDRLPDAKDIDPRINLNNQPWTLPVVMDGRTGSLRLTRTLGTSAEAPVELVVHAMRQRLDSDDRIAFPYGCSAEGAFDRYCSDGSFDFYDFRSDGERRTTDAVDVSLRGMLRVGRFTHRLAGGVLWSHHRARFNGQAFNFVGTGTIDGDALVPADPTLAFDNANRDERSLEARLQDMVALDPRWTLWAGVRATRLERRSVLTSGLEATSVRQSFATPWLALSYALDPRTQLYASSGQGVESEVVPNRPSYANAGRALPALKSRQAEVGVKHDGERFDGRLALFDIRRPVAGDFRAADGAPAAGGCSDADPCLRRSDGVARHRGLEAEGEWRGERVSLRASALWLQARRRASDDPALNGLQPTNVPARSIKLQAAYNVAAWPGLALVGFVVHEGRRMVLPDNGIATPGWTRVDLGARWTLQQDGRTLVWRLGVDNVADRRAWQEAPYQFGHAYLYPLAPRTLRTSLSATW